MQGYYIGVDVGTGSVRACLVHNYVIFTHHEIEIPRDELKLYNTTTNTYLGFCFVNVLRRLLERQTEILKIF